MHIQLKHAKQSQDPDCVEFQSGSNGMNLNLK
jgi:hypothetical protein